MRSTRSSSTPWMSAQCLLSRRAVSSISSQARAVPWDCCWRCSLGTRPTPSSFKRPSGWPRAPRGDAADLVPRGVCGSWVSKLRALHRSLDLHQLILAPERCNRLRLLESRDTLIPSVCIPLTICGTSILETLRQHLWHRSSSAALKLYTGAWEVHNLKLITKTDERFWF